MSRRPGTEAVHAALPGPMRAAVDAFARHLGSERGRSAHTVRAYVGDVVSLLDHAGRMGCTRPGDLDLGVLRSWLARLRTTGAARTSLARRAAAARTFTAWAHRDGLLDRDVAARLASPKARRDLPAVLRDDQAETLVTTPTGNEPVALRDRLILELLYATGIRVSELCGLDVDGVDRSRRVVRVLGKGAKERSVPYGQPAERALDAWLRHGRPALATPRSGSAPGAGGCNPPRHGPSCPAMPKRPACRTYRRTGCATPPRRICWRAERICVRSRSCSGTPPCPARRSTRMYRSSGCARHTGRRIPAHRIME